MSKQRQDPRGERKEDNRDIFEKVFDEVRNNPMPYGYGASALVGGILGRAGLRRALKKDHIKPRLSDDALGAAAGAAASVPLLGGPTTIAIGQFADEKNKKQWHENWKKSQPRRK